MCGFCGWVARDARLAPEPDRERIEFIRRAAIAYASTPAPNFRDGEDIWEPPTFTEAWELAQHLWDAKPEGL